MRSSRADGKDIAFYVLTPEGDEVLIYGIELGLEKIMAEVMYPDGETKLIPLGETTATMKMHTAMWNLQEKYCELRTAVLREIDKLHNEIERLQKELADHGK